MQFPLVAVPDGANVLYPVDFREVNVGAGLVLAEDEVRPVLLQVRAFRESDTVVVGIVFEPSSLNVTVLLGRVLRKVRGESLVLQGGDESDKCYPTESYTIPGIAPSCKPIA